MPRVGGAVSKAGRVAGALALQRLQRPHPNRVLYNSFNGSFSDSPRAIFEELHSRRDVTEHVWLDSGFRHRLPREVASVPPYSWSYLREIGRTGYIVSNLQMPNYPLKRRGVTYLQTWHGTPLKRIGLDNERWKANPQGLRRATRDFSHWDYLVSQNPFSSETFRRAFGFDGEILETGYPRNDILKDSRAEETRRRVRVELGVPDDTRLVLYAPTWRDNLVDERGSHEFSLALNVEAIAARLGDSHMLALRLHYLIAASLGDSLGDFGLNVSARPDIRDLYLAADVLITDYSSAMFDFAVTGKPIIFFTYDLADYRDDVRGFYFDLEAEAPGALCTDSDEVVSVLEDLDRVQAGHADRYARFRQRFCPWDDGKAAARVVDRVFGG